MADTCIIAQRAIAEVQVKNAALLQLREMLHPARDPAMWEIINQAISPTTEDLRRQSPEYDAALKERRIK